MFGAAKVAHCERCATAPRLSTAAAPWRGQPAALARHEPVKEYPLGAGQYPLRAKFSPPSGHYPKTARTSPCADGAPHAIMGGVL